MYGHSNDVICLALSSDGQYLATACKARDTTTASIFIWETRRNSCISKLVCHESSVICLRFSPDDSRVVSAGKDRSLGVHEKFSAEPTQEGSSNKEFSTVLVVKNAHKRIIWDCAWSGDGRLILTGSRDGSCKVWGIREDDGVNGIELVCLLNFTPFSGVAVTSIDIFCDYLRKGVEGEKMEHLCCMGSEGGNISILKLDVTSTWNTRCGGSGDNVSTQATTSSLPSLGSGKGSSPVMQSFHSPNASGTEIWKARREEMHGSAINRLRWFQNPGTSSEGDCFTVASAGEDCSIRVFSFLRHDLLSSSE